MIDTELKTNKVFAIFSYQKMYLCLRLQSNRK